jgi:hypothetical protein
MSSCALKGLFLGGWRNSFGLSNFLSLSPHQASFEVRGFRGESAVAQEALEGIGRTFIAGYNAALRVECLGGILDVIAQTPAQLRGFVAEGAAMGTAISDALPFRSPRLPQLVALLEKEFTYLVHVGAGWALARVPWRRRHILQPLDPLHRWLAFDGLGFHDGYFKPGKVLEGYRRQSFGYAGRAYDQGIGRALWFVSGGSVPWAASKIRQLARDRGKDLFSGLGLGMAYAGPATGKEFNEAIKLAAREWPNLAQGIAFACEARAREGFFPWHTRIAAQSIGFEASALAASVRSIRESLSAQEEEPRYEIWRRKVSEAVAQSSLRLV